MDNVTPFQFLFAFVMVPVLFVLKHFTDSIMVSALFWVYLVFFMLSFIYLMIGLFKCK